MLRNTEEGVPVEEEEAATEAEAGVGPKETGPERGTLKSPGSHTGEVKAEGEDC